MQWLTLTQQELKISRHKILIKDDNVLIAYKHLIDNADNALLSNSYSVTNKKMLPKSKNIHDYLSIAPYWWPDPTTKDGLPYMRKDGEVNPSSQDERTAKNLLVSFTHDVRVLGLAYFFDSDIKYADKLAELVYNWFLDDKLKMNPNFNYGQSILGRIAGRAAGLIESRLFIHVIDSILLIKQANVLSEQEFKNIQTWFGEFATWMLDSEIGFNEDNSYNNHAIWYDAQVTAFLIFSNQIHEAKQRLRIALRRERSLFFNDGHQPSEAERTRSLHYHCFALEAWSYLVRYGDLISYSIRDKNEPIGEEFNIRSIRSGVNFLLPYINHEKKWIYPELLDPEYESAMLFLPSIKQAYPDISNIDEVTNKLRKQFPDRIENLLYPL